MEKILHLTYASSLSKLCSINSSFDEGVLRIAYTNANRNGSYISKETYTKCAQTMFNCPIVCRYDRQSDSLGSHDVELVDTPGGLDIVNATDPVGVVPESAQPFWELVEEADGTVHEYLCTNVLLWKRQEAYQKIKRDGICAESMEINVKDGELDKDSGLFVINDFEFTAFCLLGEDVEPCFESASLEVFTTKDFKAKMTQMMADLKDTYAAIRQSDIDADSAKEFNQTEGGDVLDEKMALVAEYGLTTDELDFSIDDFTVEELREKFEALKANDSPNPPVSDEPDAQENFELNSNMVEELVRAVESTKVETWWGLSPQYCYVDYDASQSEVYAFEIPGWVLYGFAYSMDGDAVVVDFASKKRMKWAIVPYDEGSTQANPMAEVFEKASEKYNENDSKWAEKYQAASDELAAANEKLGELDSLRQFKADTEKAAEDEQRNALFEKFAKLDGIEAYENLKANCDGVSVEDLEEKFFSIAGRNGVNINLAFSHEPTAAPKIPVDKAAPVNDAPYGGLVEKYCRTAGED